MPKEKRVKITEEQAYMLKLGNDVIKRVRDVVKKGSGNQASEEKKSVHMRTAATYNLIKKIPGCENKPRRIYDIVERTETGNCDQLGAMAYALCRDYLKTDYFAAWVYVPNHSFAVIGKYTDKQHMDKWVAVDPWPAPNAEATLFKDHFCFNKKVKYIVKPDDGRGKNRGQYNATKHKRTIDTHYKWRWPKELQANGNIVFHNQEIKSPWPDDEPVEYYEECE